MDPNIWGPHAWFFFHSITLAYPDNPTPTNKHNMRTFLNSVGLVLPCYRCRNNFVKHLNKHPLTDNVLESKESLVKWMIDIHNEVNTMKGQPTMSYDQVLKLYASHYEKKSNHRYILYGTIVVLFLIIIISILIDRFRERS